MDENNNVKTAGVTLMDNEILKLIKEMLDNKIDSRFDSLDSKIDLMNTSLKENHSALEDKVLCHDSDISDLNTKVLELQNKKPEPTKYNFKYRFYDVMINYSIPILALFLYTLYKIVEEYLKRGGS